MIKLVPRESTIIRQAAVIQNNMWLYPPTDKVRKGRKEKEVKCRENFGIDYRPVKKKNWLKITSSPLWWPRKDSNLKPLQP